MNLTTRILISTALLALALPTGARAVEATEASQTSKSQPLQVDDLRRFASVFREVQASFVEPVSNKQLIDAAIFGLLSQLDPHSAYLSREQLSAFSDDAGGAYGGLGVEVQIQNGALHIVAPIDDSPATRAGLRSGDVITQIDDLVLDGAAVFQGADLLKGEIGSAVRLSVERAGVPPFEVQLMREVITLKSARAEILPGNLAGNMAWLRISAFQTDTAGSASAALKRLSQKRPLAGVVLDLRNNPGGLLAASVALSDLFLESGKIVETKGRQKSAALNFSATPGDILNGAPIVVLINAGTASAAEIVAGALKDNHRALIVGQASFGKGSVQSILPLENGDGVKLTTARYYTPNGSSIQNQGILPDVPLRELELRRAAPGLRPVKEANLANHLGNNQAEASSEPAPLNNQQVDILEADYALSEAFNMLRALALNHHSTGSSKR